MPQTFEIPTPAESSQVVAGLMRTAAHPPLPVPRELRRRGIRGIIVTVSGSEFRVVFDTTSEWAARYALHGRVETLPDRGSRIVGRMEQESRPVTSLLIPVALAVWLLVSGSRWGWGLLGIAALFFVLDTLDDQRVSPGSNVETKFLYDSVAKIAHTAASGQAGDAERFDGA